MSSGLPPLTDLERTDLRALNARFQSWLADAALPLWAMKGPDTNYGGFFETIGLDGEPCFDNKRVRVTARQIYCFALAAQNHWVGETAALIEHGWAFLNGIGGRGNGSIRHILTREGEIVNDGPDLYDQAFVLLAHAECMRITGDEQHAEQARSLLGWMRSELGHAEAGFYDRPNQKTMLRSNPHMHLLECALAWVSLDPDGPWWELAEEIVSLCRRRFVRSSDGALQEFFNADWSARTDASALIEPGHLYEWAWLLIRWQEMGGAPCDDLYRRFFELGDTYGLCAQRHVAVDSLTPDLRWTDGQARLWPQTERLKASLALAAISKGEERQRFSAHALHSALALWGYVDGLLPGLWRDKLRKDGQFVSEPAPASTFYHIICALTELDRFIKTQ